MKLILGVANLVNNYGLNNSFLTKRALAQIIKKKKIGYLDSAINYHKANQVLSRLNLTKIKISSKLPNLRKNFDIKRLIFNHLERHLKLINKTTLEDLFLHDNSVMFSRKGDEVFKILLDLKSQKLVRDIGFSVYDEFEYKYLKNFYPCKMQVPINIFNNKFKKIIENEKRIKFQARSIFMQGQLLDDFPKILGKHKSLNGYYKKLNLVCKKEGISKLKACIDFVRQIKNLESVVIGAKNEEQFDEIVKNFDNKIKFKKSIKIKKNDFKLLDARFWSLS